MTKRRVGPVQAELLSKSREAALNAVQTFNNPLTTFKAETFIVLMVIAWMYLLHAYYRREGVEYRYFDKGAKRRRFHRTKSGAHKYWELERCLNDDKCPLDSATKSNLRFQIGLRHEIEHHKSAGAGEQFVGNYLACCLNYERAVVELFGDRYGLGNALAFTLQFRDLSEVPAAAEAPKPLPSNVAKYVQQFEADLPDEEFQSPRFSCRLIFTRKLANRRGQADRAIEFISPDSELAKVIDKEYWVQKEVEKPKCLPSRIVKRMNDEGYPGFKMHHHTRLWKELDAKNTGKGYGVEVAGTWYWYERWVEVVRDHCRRNSEDYEPLSVLVGVT